ncbi:MAG: hypothetical protein CVV51_10975 [Spirochaetae bacterium HGW-Spirochaetae-7]|jgi:NitT/TauT family transport system substrate-binding protein|nr:MAG: hypothetical protein CVV51_10975 [Spirochaetae bacterium HGW-Spirochaetae-7]
MAALLLTACAKGAAKVTPAEMTIRLAYSTNLNPALVHIALEKGYFADEGLAIDARAFLFGKLAMDSMLEGESDLATCAAIPLVLALVDGKDIGIAATIVSTDRTTALVADRAAGVQKPSDLAGKTIGVPFGTAAEYFLQLLLEARGLDRKAVRIVDMKPDDMLPALKAGTVSAVSIWIPYLSSIELALAERSLVMYGNDLFTQHFIIAGNIGFMRARPAAMRALMRSLLKAEAFISDHPDEAVAIIARYTKADEAVVRSAMDLYRFKVSLDEALLLVLEDETRWAMSLPAATARKIPDIRDTIYADALQSVAPDRVRLIR